MFAKVKRERRVINVTEIQEARGEPGALETLKGMGVTLKHLINRARGDDPTIYYPEERRPYSGRFRGAHILTTREDGSPKCVACYLCATACPADCIYIEAAESPDPMIEKYPAVFNIDLLRCVYCGYCVDACPEEAIIMSREYDIAAYTREETVYNKEKLMRRPQIAQSGLGYRPIKIDEYRKG